MAEENAQLQFHKKISMNESTNLEQEIAATKAKIAGKRQGIKIVCVFMSASHSTFQSVHRYNIFYTSDKFFFVVLNDAGKSYHTPHI